MDREEVVETIRACMRDFVDRETDVTEFNYSLKPSNPLSDKGLGLTTREAWRGLLERFQNDYLPEWPPYRNVGFDTALADKTYGMELGEICFELADVLLGD